jgi:hypothetical protein
MADATTVPQELETLKAMLSAAAKMVTQYLQRSSDPLRARWEKVFDRMPIQDRQPVLVAVEHEVDLRLKMEDGVPIMGLSELRPNPWARLYLRVFDGDLPKLHHDEIMLSTLRAARIMFAAETRPSETFGAAVQAAFRELSPQERAAVARQNRYMLQLLAACDAEEVAARSAE